MAEELSPESKLYVKEEIEKSRNKFNEEVEKVKSKATKTFTTVVIIVGLLTGLGVYGQHFQGDIGPQRIRKRNILFMAYGDT